MAAGPACGSARTSDPVHGRLVPRLAARRPPPGVHLLEPAEPVTRQIFTVSRRGGDRKPAVRVVLDALSAAGLGRGKYPMRVLS